MFLRIQDPSFLHVCFKCNHIWHGGGDFQMAQPLGWAIYTYWLCVSVWMCQSSISSPVIGRHGFGRDVQFMASLWWQLNGFEVCIILKTRLAILSVQLYRDGTQILMYSRRTDPSIVCAPQISVDIVKVYFKLDQTMCVY